MRIFTSAYSDGAGKAFPFDVVSDPPALVTCHILDSVAENITENALIPAPVFFQIHHAHMDLPTGTSSQKMELAHGSTKRPAREYHFKTLAQAAALDR